MPTVLGALGPEPRAIANRRCRLSRQPSAPFSRRLPQSPGTDKRLPDPGRSPTQGTGLLRAASEPRGAPPGAGRPRSGCRVVSTCPAGPLPWARATLPDATVLLLPKKQAPRGRGDGGPALSSAPASGGRPSLPPLGAWPRLLRGPLCPPGLPAAALPDASHGPDSGLDPENGEDVSLTSQPGRRCRSADLSSALSPLPLPPCNRVS